MDITIRTITLSIGDSHPLVEEHIARAAAFLSNARAAAEAAGYTVQTVRIATRPLLADMAATDDTAIEAYTAILQNWCADYDMDYCSLGAVPADDAAFPVERIALLPRILAPHEALNATVQLGSAANGVRYEAALAAALAMCTLSEHGDGDANFRFAALACCEPGGPFFPQAFAAGPEWSVSVGLQSAGLVERTIETLVERTGSGLPALAGLTTTVGAAIEWAARPVVDLVREQAQSSGFAFGGIDLSPAPMGDESIADAIEAVGLGLFGAPGTLAVAAALTAAIKSPALPQCGYCGLMLPVLEDETLGERCAEGDISITSLLAYSAVCGTGLDTVPIPGDTPPEHVAALLADVASLAVRLRKPLSARLFLVPGGAAGDITNFASPYLTNSRILSV
jgi:uncharacterized protein